MFFPQNFLFFIYFRIYLILNNFELKNDTDLRIQDQMHFFFEIIMKNSLFSSESQIQGKIKARDVRENYLTPKLLLFSILFFEFHRFSFLFIVQK
jgi:hypothetical protein